MGEDRSPRLTGTVSVVTGGGRGIGRVVSQLLAADGSAIAVLARSESELSETVALIEEDGGTAAAWSVDVTDGFQVEGAISRIEATMGPISLLVNNAGDSRGTGPLWETDPEEWWRVMEVNLRGPYLLSHAVVSRMVERRSGRIINVASNVAIQPAPFATAYSCSKAALLRLTDSLAESVRSFGVQVFAISPGFVWTSMTERVVEEMKKFIPGFEGIPDSDTSPPELAGRLIVELARGRADALTGRYIHVNDDFDGILSDAGRIEEEDLLALRLTEWEPVEGT